MPFKELQERITELERKMGNLLFYGVVAEVNKNKVRVIQGDLKTGWIPVFQAAAGNDQIFTPITEGEMVCVVCPNGSIENGGALRGLNYKSKPIPAGADNGVFVLKLADTEIKFTKNSNEIQISGSGDIKIDVAAAKSVQITGPVKQPLCGVVTDKSPCPVFGVFHQSPSPILKTTIVQV